MVRCRYLKSVCWQRLTAFLGWSRAHVDVHVSRCKVYILVGTKLPILSCTWWRHIGGRIDMRDFGSSIWDPGFGDLGIWLVWSDCVARHFGDDDRMLKREMMMVTFVCCVSVVCWLKIRKFLVSFRLEVELASNFNGKVTRWRLAG